MRRKLTSAHLGKIREIDGQLMRDDSTAYKNEFVRLNLDALRRMYRKTEYSSHLHIRTTLCLTASIHTVPHRLVSNLSVSTTIGVRGGSLGGK